MTDAELVACARGGDHAAFGELVQRHQAAVQRAALAAVSSATDADDVAQEAFLLAYRRLGSFRGDASFKTWLLTIVWNQAINHRRTSGRWWRRFVSADTGGASAFEPAHVVSATSTPEDLAAHGQLCDAVRRAISSLAPKLRDALLLAQSGDYSYEEIGAMLKVPAGTIKWRVFEARRVVRQHLEAHGHGPRAMKRT